MKFHAQVLALLAIGTYADAQCLTDVDLAAAHCSYDALLVAAQDRLHNDAGCTAVDATTELAELFGSADLARAAVAGACAAAAVPFSAITERGAVFDKEYYDGGTYYNEGRESRDEHGIATDRLAADPGARIDDVYDNVSQSRAIAWPGHLSNFDQCDLNAVMCCFTQDRQAGDNNGNCAEPYDENCVDADPADNTDVCYVDMERAPTASRTSQGFAIFEKNAEEDSHCHGFAWSEDPSDPSARFAGNKLFYVSMYDHLTQRGYARNVPGAPMCACVEQMPVVTRADCTQVDIESETAVFNIRIEDGSTELTADISNLSIEFNACQGANGNNNDLAAYYERLVDEEKISEEKHADFEKTVVGKTYCPEAIAHFLDEQGLAPKPACRFGYPAECGCESALQKDYRGTLSVTRSGRECQRWDEQAPHSHSRTRGNYPDANLVENYCRNPDNEGGTWCYTTDPDVRWEYCDVPYCEDGLPTPAPTESPTTADEVYPCAHEENQKDYRGRINETREGYPCQAWSSQRPHQHRYSPLNYPDAGLESNYCRNPSGNAAGTWCYIADPAKRWSYCDVPTCSEDTEAYVLGSKSKSTAGKQFDPDSKSELTAGKPLDLDSKSQMTAGEVNVLDSKSQLTRGGNVRGSKDTLFDSKSQLTPGKPSDP